MAHALDDRFEVLRAKGTVDAQCADTEAGQREGRRFCGDTGKRASRGLEGHGHEDRFPRGVFPCREDGRFRFVEVRHGLDDDDIGVFRRVHLLREQVVGVLKGEGTGRLEKLTDGADVEGDQDIGAFRGGLRVFQRRFDDRLGRIAAAFQLVGVRAEGVGVDEVGARVDVGFVEGRDEVRMREVQRLRVVFIGNTALLDERTGGAVEEQKVPFRQKSIKIHSGHLVVYSCSCPAGCRWHSPVCAAGALSPKGP